MSRHALGAVSLLLGGLLPAWAQAHAARTGPLGATRTVAGVRISLAAPPGPHFLGELVSVTVTVTNTTQRPVRYTGSATPTLCESGWVSLAGGSAPFYHVPTPRGAFCPGQLPATLAPGHTVSMRGLLPLTASGTVRLMASPIVVRVVVTARATSLWAHSLAGPSLLLHVAATVPATRTLLLTYHNSTVRVRVAQGCLPALVVQTMEQYTTGWGATGDWAPLKGATVVEPHSPSMGHPTTWTVLVGAPGYRVAVGVYTHAP